MTRSGREEVISPARDFPRPLPSAARRHEEKEAIRDVDDSTRRRLQSLRGDLQSTPGPSAAGEQSPEVTREPANAIGTIGDFAGN